MGERTLALDAHSQCVKDVGGFMSNWNNTLRDGSFSWQTPVDSNNNNHNHNNNNDIDLPSFIVATVLAVAAAAPAADQPAPPYAPEPARLCSRARLCSAPYQPASYKEPVYAPALTNPPLTRNPLMRSPPSTNINTLWLMITRRLTSTRTRP
ncbi:hypothetical protein TCAL_15725, partial [Tigriopus californicus]